MRWLRDKRGFSLMWWSVFAAFTLVPLIVLSMGVARYATAAAEVQEAADLAALAASRDILVGVFERDFYVQWADQVPYRTAHRYANSCTEYLDQHGIEVIVEEIWIDEAHDTVMVRVSADLEPLFPQFYGLALDTKVVREGQVQLYMRAHVPDPD